MSTITLISGLPRSGKSQIATNIICNRPDTVRVSIQDYRQMLFRGTEYRVSQEIMAGKCLKALIESLMVDQKNIVLDDMNLSQGRIEGWKKYAEANCYKFEHIDLRKKPIRDILIADAKTTNPIGRDRILNLAFEHKLAKADKEYVIWEIDNILADNSERHIQAWSNEGFDPSIFLDKDLMAEDKPVSLNIDKLQHEHTLGYDAVILTARMEKFRGVTEKWLEDHEIPYSRLIMRPNGNSDKLVDYKRKMYLKYLDPDWCSEVVENDEESMNMWESLGISVVRIGDLECLGTHQKSYQLTI